MFMPVILAWQATASTALPCRQDQLSMGVAERDSSSDGAPVAGAVISIRNHGPDCVLPPLPLVTLRAIGGGALSATRSVPRGMHPGPALVPILLTGGHRATFELTWRYCASEDRCVRVASMTLRFGAVVLNAPVGPTIGRSPAAPFRFDEDPGQVVEGMASDLD